MWKWLGAGLVLIILVVGAIFFFWKMEPSEEGAPQPLYETVKDAVQKEERTTMTKEEQLAVLAESLLGGGPAKDGIPPIETPVYVDVDAVGDFLTDDDVVFVMQVEDKVFVYPQKILVWHEVVNDSIAEEAISVTYSPLSGSVMGFAHDQSVSSSLGTSGQVLNSSLVVYDRQTNSLFPQLLKVAVSGPRAGEELSMVTLDWSRWGTVRASFPSAQVLSEKTGYPRDYDSDPYGSYFSDDSYYQVGGPFFPVLHQDERLGAKQLVMGVYGAQGGRAAILLDAVTPDRSVTFELDDETYQAVFDESLQSVRIYKGAAGDSTGELADYVQVMWFAWSAFFADTDVYK